MRNAANNINQVAKRANETRSVHRGAVEELRRNYDLLIDQVGVALDAVMKLKDL
jgi:hypothetical protein